MARRIRRPISESAADVAVQKCLNYEPIWHGEFSCPARPVPNLPQPVRWLGGSASPYQNPRLMLLFRLSGPTYAKPAPTSQMTRRIRQPISESAADVAAQKCLNYEPIWHECPNYEPIWHGGSTGPYQNPLLMLLFRNVQITNQFGTVNLVVWADLCHSSQITRKIRRPISESVADVAVQKCLNYEPIWHGEFSCLARPMPNLPQPIRWLGGSASPYQNPRLMLLLRLSGLTCAKPAPTSQMARKIRRPISESAADVAVHKCPNYEPIWHGEFSCLARPVPNLPQPVRWLGGSAGPYQNPRLMLLFRNVQITNQFGTVNLVVRADLCHSSQIATKIRRPISESAADVAAQKCPNYEPIWHARSQRRSAGPYQNPRLMLLFRNVQITNQFGTVNLVVWADNVQITNQFGTVNLVVWADLCHSSQIAMKIRRPISESAADVAVQTRSQGRSAGPYQNPRLMLLFRLSGLTCAKPAPTTQMARRIRRPISESAADVAVQTRSQGRSAGPYQNPRLMLLLRNVQLRTNLARASATDLATHILEQNVQITNQFGMVNLVVWPDLCHSSQIASKIRRPISESAADVAAQTRSQARSAGPYQNPRLMLLLRASATDLATHILEQNVQITNQFGMVNLVVRPDLCHSSQIARKIRRPISESAADVAAQIWTVEYSWSTELLLQCCTQYLGGQKLPMQPIGL
ncbi:hypothetical protein GGX14DRAFT_387264 [Mycena pura]|uniref:Uncharacterized protein n=1 Tax=Mycena pura TaxID=153505 RepID=A0AAD7E2D4_9AGAR|nr:hypothetical protein GGX14DRAFT_387264 [Mycena pura]